MLFKFALAANFASHKNLMFSAMQASVGTLVSLSYTIISFSRLSCHVVCSSVLHRQIIISIHT